MAERLKDIFFTRSSLGHMADIILRLHPDFDRSRFLELIFDAGWDQKELKAKMHHTTACLHDTLPQSYPEALDILMNAAPSITGFDAMALPDYVELYGLDDWDRSLPALRYFTKYSSSEFAIRPFLAANPERSLAFLIDCAGDEDERVRRFASEGCRPRLPWAMALPAFKKDPTPLLPILEKLKDDESESVRRSVANNLNDISKDHPELVLDICERWFGHSKRTDAIAKQACRGMLKAGNRRAMAIFGFDDGNHIRIENFRIRRDTVTIGEELPFSFELVVDEEERTKVRLEYAIDFRKATGKSSRKVFQISENTWKRGRHTITRKHAFVDMSTRKHHAGTHRISVIANGTERASTSFELTQ